MKTAATQPTHGENEQKILLSSCWPKNCVKFEPWRTYLPSSYIFCTFSPFSSIVFWPPSQSTFTVKLLRLLSQISKLASLKFWSLELFTVHHCWPVWCSEVMPKTWEKLASFVNSHWTMARDWPVSCESINFRLCADFLLAAQPTGNTQGVKKLSTCFY